MKNHRVLPNSTLKSCFLNPCRAPELLESSKVNRKEKLDHRDNMDKFFVWMETYMYKTTLLIFLTAIADDFTNNVRDSNV